MNGARVRAHHLLPNILRYFALAHIKPLREGYRVNRLLGTQLAAHLERSRRYPHEIHRRDSVELDSASAAAAACERDDRHNGYHERHDPELHSFLDLLHKNPPPLIQDATQTAQFL
jgi:hypothetical protein